MSYKDLSKIIPDDIKSGTGFLDKIIEEEEEESSSSSSDESSPAVKTPPAVRTPAAVKTVKKSPEESEGEKKALIAQLMRWQASYAYFESLNPPKIIPNRLKDKVTKSLSQGFDVKISALQSLVNELKFVAGYNYASPPDQADAIIRANHLVELALVKSGYDVSGFANEVSLKCKDPLIMCLIENDLLNGMKVNPLHVLGLTYISALGGAYLRNKAVAASACPPGAVESPPQGSAVPAAVQAAAAALPPLDVTDC